MAKAYLCFTSMKHPPNFSLILVNCSVAHRKLLVPSYTVKVHLKPTTFIEPSHYYVHFLLIQMFKTFYQFKNPLIRPPCYYKQYYFTSTRRTKGSNTYPLNIVFPSLPIVRIAEHFAVESEIEIQNKDHLVVDLRVNEHN